jgi:hypothetical protein
MLLVLGLAALTAGCNERANTLELRFAVVNQAPVAAELRAVNWASGATIGTVTPPLIAPGARTEVVVDVPIGFRGWGLSVNAGNGGGTVVFTGSDVLGCSGDVPIEVHISRTGESSWHAPHGNWCGNS